MKNNNCIDISITGDFYIEDNAEIKPLDKLAQHFDNRDVVCMNLEGPICEAGDANSEKIGPCIRQGNGAKEILVKLGCTLVTLANNHIMDYGYDCLNETMRVLQGCGIQFIGAGKETAMVYKGYILQKEGIKVGIINAAENGFGSYNEECVAGGYAWIFSGYVKKEIERLRYVEKCDKIIGIFHAGVEDIHYPLPEWRNVYRQLIDEGLDLIVAHHPHVMQGVEEYKNKKIYYSLGNFIWADNKKTVSENHVGMVVDCHIESGKEIETEVFWLRNDEREIKDKQLSEEQRAFEEYSNYLRTENENMYSEIMREILPELYERLYKHYIKNTVGILEKEKMSLWIRIKYYLINLKNAVFSNYRVHDMWVLHNMQIESHRWACLRAIRYIEEKKEQ